MQIVMREWQDHLAGVACDQHRQKNSNIKPYKYSFDM